MSVRDLERAAKESHEKLAKPAKKKPKVDPNLAVAEEKLGLKLGARVHIQTSKRGGKILINCATNDEMMRVFDLLMEE